MDARPRRRVSHPILHLEVLAPDGSRAAEQHVFCRLRRESVEVAECSGCNHCDAIKDGPAPSVDCTFALPIHELTPDPRGDRTEVGTLLRSGAVVVSTSTSLRDAMELLRAHDFRSVNVVGGDHILVGVLHDRILSERCVRLGAAGLDVTVAMSSPFAIQESTPVRPALRFLASAHLREAAVVTSKGVPLGVFTDIVGLRWIARAREGSL